MQSFPAWTMWLIAPSPQWLKPPHEWWSVPSIMWSTWPTRSCFTLVSLCMPLTWYLWRNDIRVREARAGEKLVTLTGKSVSWKQVTRDYGCWQSGSPAVSWAERLQKLLKAHRVKSLKLSSMANRSVRQVVKPVLRSESSSRFEKGINVATVNEALDAAASMIAELAGTVSASFQQAKAHLM